MRREDLDDADRPALRADDREEPLDGGNDGDAGDREARNGMADERHGHRDGDGSGPVLVMVRRRRVAAAPGTG